MQLVRRGMKKKTTKHNKNTIQPAATARLDISVYVIGTVLLCNWLTLFRIL